MSWIELVTSGVLASIITGIGSILYFKPRLKQENAGAKKAETEAKRERHDFMMDRIKDMEELYKKQGDMLDQVRREVLELKDAVHARDEQVQALKTENEGLKRQVETLSAKNQTLSLKVANLEQEIETYKSTK